MPELVGMGMSAGTLAHDIRVALRALWRQKTFAAAATLTLALGIGPNTAIFSAVEALLLRPLPFPDSDRLVRVESMRGGESGSISYREARDMQELQNVFEDVAVYTDQGQYNASGDGRPEELVSTITTQNLFRVLGVPPTMGAPWAEQMDRTRGFNVVISHSLWQRRFNGDPQIIGRAMTLDGAPGYTILGVMPEGFAFPVRSDLYRSHGIAAAATAYEDRATRGRWGIARLKENVTIEQANAALTQLAQRLEREFANSNTGVTYRATALRDMYVGDARPYLVLVLAAVGLVLLIACGNVTNLILSRSLAREREVAVRTALGASRWRVVRLLLTESTLLAVCGGLLGVLLGALALRALVALIRLDLPIWLSIELSPVTLAYTALISLLTGLVVGLVPALRLVRGDLTGSLKEGARGASGGLTQRRLRSSLVVVEVALAMVLLVGAGLLTRSFIALVRSPAGFNTDSLLTFRVENGWRAYPGLANLARFQRTMLARLGELTEVRSVAMISNLPLDGRPKTDHVVRLEGQAFEAQRTNPYVNLRIASVGVFETLQIPLVRGRTFTEADRDSALGVAVVARATAERLWPGRDAIGMRLLLGTAPDTSPAAWRSVVGVVENVRHESLASAPSLDVYVPNEQVGTGGSYYLLRTRGSPMAIATRATQLVWSIDPNQSFFDVRTMQDRVDDRVWVPRLSGRLFTAFAALAALLAAVGIFAVLAYNVAQRTREFGIRLALGAAPSALSRQVTLEGLRVVALGAGVGLLIATAAAFAMRRLLFGVSALDVTTLIVATTSLLIVATVACWLPSRRATRVMPMSALRAE
jgi:putative ABC transport system permease protein